MTPATQRRPSRRSVATRAKWQHHLNVQASSGLKQSAYCREYGLNAKYFSLWKRKLRVPSDVTASAITITAPPFIPVIVKPIRSSAARAAHPQAPPADTGHLIIKAILQNGVAIEWCAIHAHSVRKLPRQSDSSKIEFLAASAYSAGIRSPSKS
jgi:hypothetical protein